MKKVFSLVLVAVLLLSTSPIAFAHDPGDYEQMRAPACDHCDIGVVRKSTITYSQWVTVDYPRCPKNRSMLDEEQERSYITTYKCTKCEVGYNERTTELRIKCDKAH